MHYRIAVQAFLIAVLLGSLCLEPSPGNFHTQPQNLSPVSRFQTTHPVVSIYRASEMNPEQTVQFNREYSLFKLGGRIETFRYAILFLKSILSRRVDLDNAFFFVQSFFPERTMDRLIHFLAKDLGLPFVFFKEEEATTSYCLLADKDQRRAMIEGRMKPGLFARQAKGKDALVLDDALVSGAKMEESFRVLREVGVRRIYPFVIFHLDENTPFSREGTLNSWVLDHDLEDLIEGINTGTVKPTSTLIKALIGIGSGSNGWFTVFVNRLHPLERKELLDQITHYILTHHIDKPNIIRFLTLIQFLKNQKTAWTYKYAAVQFFETSL